MHHFFVDRSGIFSEEKKVLLTGENYNHLKNVLRAKPGEKVIISDGEGTDYQCTVSGIDDLNADGSPKAEPSVVLKIDFVEAPHELPADIYLFQGLPKQDKMELIVQKAVELGAHAVVPVETKNTVVKLDDKRAQKKVERWQAIAEAAAKQSKRSIVPEVKPVMSWREALQFTEDFDLKLIPYENAHDMKKTLSELQNVPKHGKIAVFIGPEGGFDEAEIVDAEAHEFVPISLGKRILRTETAAIASMSVFMMTLELQSAEG